MLLMIASFCLIAAISIVMLPIRLQDDTVNSSMPYACFTIMSRHLLYGKLPGEGNDAYKKHAEETLVALGVIAKFAGKETVLHIAGHKVGHEMDKVVARNSGNHSAIATNIVNLLATGNLIREFPHLAEEIEHALKQHKQNR